MSRVIVTRDKVQIGIQAVHLAHTLAGLIEGNRAFCWKIAVDDAAARNPWNAWPLHVLEPIGLSRKDMPPHWRVSFLLGSGVTIKDPTAEGSQLVLMCFREGVLDLSAEEMLRDVAGDFAWMPHAADSYWL